MVLECSLVFFIGNFSALHCEHSRKGRVVLLRCTSSDESVIQFGFTFVMINHAVMCSGSHCCLPVSNSRHKPERFERSGYISSASMSLSEAFKHISNHLVDPNWIYREQSIG